MTTEFNDAEHYALFKLQGALRSGTAFEVRWSEIVLAALRSAGLLDNMVDGLEPPAINRLWLDKNSDPAVLKEWDGAGLAWQPVTFKRMFERAVVTPMAAATGSANELIVDEPVPFIASRLYSLTPAFNNTGATVIKITGVGTYPVNYPDGADLDVDELRGGHPTILIFTGDRFEVLFKFADFSTLIVQAEAAISATESATNAAVAAAEAAVAAVNGNLEFPTRDDAQAATIDENIHALRLTGSAALGDGLGGLFVDDDNGSTDAFESADGRTWYRVRDVGLDRLAVDLSGIVNSSGLPSPMDYGAVGDGVTDDYAAIAAAMAANAGRVLSGRGRTFYSSVRPQALSMIDGLVRISGTYDSGGGPYSFSQSLSFAPPTSGGGINLTAAKQNYSSAWIASLGTTTSNSHIGGLAYDVAQKRWFAMYEITGSGTSYISSYNRWFGDLSEATKYPADARIGHQGFCIDRRGASGSNVYAWTAVRYHETDRPIAGRQVARFRLQSTSVLSEWAVYTLFGSDFTHVTGHCMPSISPCGKFLVAAARKLNGRDWWVRVFDAGMLIAGGEGDYSDKYITQWGVDPSMYKDDALGNHSPCQNVMTDGTSVFFIHGGSAKTAKTIAHYDIGGRLIEICYDINIGNSTLTGEFYEPQAMCVYRNNYGSDSMAVVFKSNPGGSYKNMVFEVGPQQSGYMIEPVSANSFKFVARSTADGVLRSTTITLT